MLGNTLLVAAVGVVLVAAGPQEKPPVRPIHRPASKEFVMRDCLAASREIHKFGETHSKWKTESKTYGSCAISFSDECEIDPRELSKLLNETQWSLGEGGNESTTWTQSLPVPQFCHSMVCLGPPGDECINMPAFWVDTNDEGVDAGNAGSPANPAAADSPRS